MSLAQDKALEFVFCDPITDGLWDRVFTDSINYAQDKLCEMYSEFSDEDLQKILINLADEFQEIYNLGFQDGLTYEGE